MHIIIMGPQGSGKSTQAQLLARRLKTPCLSTGEIFRKISKEKTALGRRVKRIMNGGQLVDDKTTIEVVKKFLEKPTYQKGVVFEGFPRNFFQAKNLPLKIDKVFYLTLSRKEALRRLTARRICKKCGANFNLLTSPPKVEGRCDLCKGSLYQREDDTKRAVLKRLELFDQETKPVLDYYRKQSILQEVDGERPIKEIFRDLAKRVKKVACGIIL